MFEVIRPLIIENRSLPAHFTVCGSTAPTQQSQRRALRLLPKQALIDELQCLNKNPAFTLRDSKFMALILPCLRSDFFLHSKFAELLALMQQQLRPLDHKAASQCV